MKSILKGFTVEESVLLERTTLPADKHSIIFDWSNRETVVAISPVGSSLTIEPQHILGIYFDPSFIKEVLEIENFPLAPQSNITDPFLAAIATKLTSVCDGALAETIYPESLGVACVVHLAKQYSSADVSFPKGRLNPYQLKQVVDFAHSYMQFNIGLHEMAGQVHLSPYHFGRLFKQTVGKSPYQFILQLKIEAAKKLIKKNQGPISEIAYQLNFSDQSHFSNAFRKATGVSPRQYLAAAS